MEVSGGGQDTGGGVQFHKMSSTKRLRNVCIITSPVYSHNDSISLDGLILMLEPIVDELFVITGRFPNRYGDKVHITEIETSQGETERSYYDKLAGFITMQFKLSFHLIKLSRNFPVVLFHVGEYRNPMPFLWAKLLRKKTVIFHIGGNKFTEPVFDEDSFIIRWMPHLLIPPQYALADVIICEAESIISYGELEKYRQKVVVLPERYIDTREFQFKKPPSQRAKRIGHIGRLSPKKGITKLVKAMPFVLKECDDVELLLSGRGEIRDQIEQEIEKNGIKDKVKFVDWISDEELPDYLNELLLFVLPSSDEGVPGMVQKAMACGAIAIATPVGGIPSLIQDEETGFIIDDNTPEGVARTILRALKHSDLNRIAKQAQALIERDYDYGIIVDGYKKLLESL